MNWCAPARCLKAKLDLRHGCGWNSELPSAVAGETPAGAAIATLPDL